MNTKSIGIFIFGSVFGCCLCLLLLLKTPPLTEQQEDSYVLGLQISKNLKRATSEITARTLFLGIEAGLSDQSRYPDEIERSILNRVHQKIREKSAKGPSSFSAPSEIAKPSEPARPPAHIPAKVPLFQRSQKFNFEYAVLETSTSPADPKKSPDLINETALLGQKIPAGLDLKLQICSAAENFSQNDSSNSCFPMEGDYKIWPKEFRNAAILSANSKKVLVFKFHEPEVISFLMASSRLNPENIKNGLIITRAEFTPAQR